jgi:hypothetical protein
LLEQPKGVNLLAGVTIDNSPVLEERKVRDIRAGDEFIGRRAKDEGCRRGEDPDDNFQTQEVRPEFQEKMPALFRVVLMPECLNSTKRMPRPHGPISLK